MEGELWYLQTLPGQPTVLHVVFSCRPVDLKHIQSNIYNSQTEAFYFEIRRAQFSFLSHPSRGQVHAVGTQEVDVVFPSDQQPPLVLVQQQGLVAAADSALPEDGQPVPQIWGHIRPASEPPTSVWQHLGT